MGCEPERVTGYVDGALEPEAAWSTEVHLWRCRDCAAQARLEMELASRLRSLRDLLPPSPGLARRVVRAAPGLPAALVN